MEGDPVIRLMGPVAIFESERTVEITSARQRRLLAALAISAPDVVSVDRLVDIVWGGMPPESAPRTLQSYVSRLRSRLGGARSSGGDEALERAEPGYLLSSSITSDASAFETMAAEAREAIRMGGFSDAAATLERALGLWRGEPIAEFADEDWARPYAHRLAERRVTALEDLAECELRLGNPGGAIARLDQLVGEQPLRERPRALLMRSLFAAGRQPEAVRAYRDFYSLLADEVGLGPSPALVELAAQIATGTLPVDEPARSTAVGLTEGRFPSGTVTFLFTDVEESTRFWDEHHADMEHALERHDAVVRGAIEGRGGYVFTTAGDSFAASFARAADAVAAAVSAQSELSSGGAGPPRMEVRVRMGLHTGEAHERDGDYFGPAVNRAARLMSAANGGQVVASSATRDVALDTPLEGVTFVELGTHRLKDLSAPVEVFDVRAVGLAERFGPLRTLDRVDHNLAIPATELIGRHDEVERLSALVRTQRLLTVVGVGGIGKTRLMLQTAAQVVEDFPDGVWWCELAPISDPDSIPDLIAAVMGVRQRPGSSMIDSIVEYCRDRQLLIALDNCEHVLDAVADLVQSVNANAAKVSILATSREPIGQTGEQIASLAPLPIGDGSPAVELFCERAADHVGTRDWTTGEIAAIERICDRLDGVPLAIELAASRTRSLTPAEIEARLGDAFRLLRGKGHGLERHRTMQGAIDWSYQSLSPQEQTVFERLAVFAGTFDLAAAEAVCRDHTTTRARSINSEDVLDTIDNLVNKSLVLADTTGVHTRYRLLEPLRQYAQDRLARHGDDEETRAAHLTHYVEWAEQLDRDSWNDETTWRDRLDADWTNLRAAMGRALSNGSLDAAARTIASLTRAQLVFNRYEIGPWALRTLEMQGIGEHPCGPKVAGTAGTVLWGQGNPAGCRAVVATGMAMPIVAAGDAFPRINQSMVAVRMDGDIAAARALWDEIDSTDLYQLVATAWVRTTLDIGGPNADTDLRALRKATAESPSLMVAAMAEQAEAIAAMRCGDFPRAVVHGRAAVDAAEKLRSTFFVYTNLMTLSLAASAADGLNDDDLVIVERCLREQQTGGLVIDQWSTLLGLVPELWRRGEHALARDIHAGLTTSPLRQSEIEVVKLFAPQIEASSACHTEPPTLHELTDRTIETIAASRFTRATSEAPPQHSSTTAPEGK